MNPSPALGFDAVEALSDKLVVSFVRPLFEEVAGAVPPTASAADFARRRRAERRVGDALAIRGANPKATRGYLAALVGQWSAVGFRDDFDAASSLEEALPVEPQDPEDAHRAAIVEKYGRIEIRGLQTSARVWQSLDLAYVPLHVDDEGAAVEIEGMPGLPFRRAPRLSVSEAFAAHPRLLVLGAPGSGKSTVAAWLACALADRGLEGALADLVPFVVLVRAGGDPLSIAALAKESGLTTRRVDALLRKGRAAVLVDGLDEAREPDVFFAKLRGFCERWPLVRVMATARPAAVEGAPLLSGMHPVRIAPLTTVEVGTFVERWCLSAEVSVQAKREDAEITARAAAEDLNARIRASRPVQQLATNPLVCGVVCVVHRFLGQRIPERRAALYEACSNVLLYDWDRAKFPADAAIGKLDAPQKRSLLSAIAWEMHNRRVAELPEAEVRACLEMRLPDVDGDEHDAGRILDEIRLRSGLLVERSDHVFGFSHLAFQEYFAAREAVHLGVVPDLADHTKDAWWQEVIVLAAGLPDARPADLIRALLVQDGEDEVGAGTALAAQCVSSAVEVPLAVRRGVEARLATLVPPRSDADAVRIANIGVVLGPSLAAGLVHELPDVRAWTAAAVCLLPYEPLLPRVADLLDDGERMTGGVTVRFVAAVYLLLQAPDAEAVANIVRENRDRGDLERLIRSFFATKDEHQRGLARVGITPRVSPEKPRPKRAARTG